MSRGKQQRSFAKGRTQAERATLEMRKAGQVAGLGTARTYADALKVVHDWMRANGGGSLQELSIRRARQFLNERAGLVSQSTLDRDRQAVQALLQHNGKLTADQHLRVIQAERQQSGSRV